MEGEVGSGGGMVEIIGNANKAKLEHSTEVLHTHTNTHTRSCWHRVNYLTSTSG